MLIRLSWYQYFNSCHNDFIHLILTEEHKKLSIVTDLTFLSLVSRTGNFIPTPPANQLIFNVKRSLHVLQGRIHSILSHKVNYTVITNSKAAAAAIGIPNW